MKESRPRRCEAFTDNCFKIPDAHRIRLIFVPHLQTTKTDQVLEVTLCATYPQ
jgi:hypothetical protein